MNIIRKLKISKVTEVIFTEVEKEAINLINDWISDLTVFIDENRPDEINYMKGDLFVLQQDNINNILYVRYDGFWKVLNIEYNDIQTLIKYMVEQAFKHKLQVSSLFLLSYPLVIEIEEAFKKQVGTPMPSATLTSMLLEEAFKKQVSK